MKLSELKKKSRDIADALSDKNSSFNALIAFVSENLASESIIPFTVADNADADLKKHFRDEIRKRYEDIIDKKLWRRMCKWFDDAKKGQNSN